jgi:hypothetical protein
MRKILCISIAAIGLGMIEAGPTEAQTQAQAQGRCQPGWSFDGRTCVPQTTRRTGVVVTPEPATTGYGFYRRNPGNPCGDPHLTIQEGACRGW